VKSGITLVVTVAAGGTKLPLYFIAKGTTEKCTEKLEVPKPHRADYSESGWMRGDVMINYLRKLIVRHTKDVPCMLILDSYGAHICDEVRAYATKHKIELLVVPPCMTATLSPLDVGINGPLKSMYSKAWRRERLFDNDASSIPGWSSATSHAITSYNRVTSSCILSAFNNSVSLPPPSSSTLITLQETERLISSAIHDSTPPPPLPSPEDIRGSDNYSRRRAQSFQYQPSSRSSIRLSTLNTSSTRNDAIIAQTLSQLDSAVF
jgi:hypothetical protein